MTSLGSWAVIAGALFFFVTLEFIWPLRASAGQKKSRWVSNMGIFVLNTLTTSLVISLSGLGAALFAAQHHWGVLNWLSVPLTIAIAISFVTLDIMAYVLHRVFHASPLLWPMHAVHHSDADLDATTAIRHHPLEIIVGAVMNIPVVVLLGMPPISVLLYAGVAGIVQIFHHSNISLPHWLGWLRFIIVVPEMHQVHHSMQVDEADSNFSAIFSWWDRLWGTLRYQPDVARFGVAKWSDPEYQRIDQLVSLPMHMMDEEHAR